MRAKTVRLLFSTLLLSVVAILFCGLTNFYNVGADIIDVPDTESSLQLELIPVTEDNVLTRLEARVTGGTDYQYQFWVKKNVGIDSANADSGNLSKEIFVWSLEQAYSVESSADITLTNTKDAEGRYNIIARVRNLDGIIVKELFGCFTDTEIGNPVISYVAINEKAVEEEVIVQKDGNALNVKIFANMNDLDYELTSGDVNLDGGITQGASAGEFSVDISNFKTGAYKFIARAISGGIIVEKPVYITVLDSYLPNQMPVIESLTGITEDGINSVTGYTKFYMQIKYANGMDVSAEDGAAFVANLSSGGISATELRRGIGLNPQTPNTSFEIEFGVDYGGKYGIYYTYGTVSRPAVSACDDSIIAYYSGYARKPATLSLNVPSSAEAGNPVALQVSGGSIEGVESAKLLYAFYREDASGWTSIKDYNTEASMTWIPIKSGIYNIQARIKDADNVGGSYEAVAERTLTVTGSMLAGNVTVSVSDYQTKVAVAEMEAGKPYIISASYNGEEAALTSGELLYRFTVYNRNLGTQYLTDFTPNCECIFVPNKGDDSYIFGVRTIALNSLGYKDVSGSLEMTSTADDPVAISLSDDTAITLYSGISSISYPSQTRLTASVQYAGVQLENAVISWESDDETVATVSDGTITAIGEGTASIKAVYTYNNKAFEKSVAVTVISAITETVTEEGTSISATLDSKHVLVYENTVNLNGKTSTEPFVRFNFNILDENNNIGNRYTAANKPVKNVYIVLQDASDSNNYLLIRFGGTWDPGFYASTTLDGSKYRAYNASGTFYSNGKGQHTYGEDICLSFAKEAGVDTLYMKDMSKQEYAKLVQPSVDLNTSWLGFTDGNVKISIYAVSFTTEEARVDVTVSEIDGQSPTKENMNVNFGLYSGITMDIGREGKLQYDDVIDFNGKTIDDMFIEFTVAPNSAEYIDATEIFVELTNVEDQSKVLLFKSFSHLTVADRSFAAAGIPSHISGRSGSTDNPSDIKTNVWNGFLVRSSFSGFYLMSLGGAGMGFSLDISTGDVYAQHGRNSEIPSNFIMNYNNTAYMPADKWSGFGSGRYKLAIYATNYNDNAEKTTLIIKSVNGQSVTEQDFTYINK